MSSRALLKVVLFALLSGAGISVATAQGVDTLHAANPAGKAQKALDDGTDTESEIVHCITGPGMPITCFDTEAEAVYAASEGRVTLQPGETARSRSEEELYDGITGVMGTLYSDADYGGSTLTVHSDGCYGWNNLAGAWNDIISSVRTGSCGITLYEHTNKTGPSLSISSPGTNYVGAAMNDKASSWSLP